MGTSTPALDAVKRLVDRFDRDRKVFLSPDYKEEQLRNGLLSPNLVMLGGINMRIVLAALLCLICSSSARTAFGGTALLLWPTARSVALGGAMTAMADEPDAEFWNPGGLGFQPGASLSVSGRRWRYTSDLRYLSGGWTFSRVAGADIDVNAGLNLRQVDDDPQQVINDLGRLIGTYRPSEAACGIHGGVAFGKRFGAGIALKYFHAVYIPGWVFDSLGVFPPGSEDLGASALAADAGLLYRPLSRLSVGLAVSSFGTKISYTRSAAASNLPTTVRLGVCGTPVDIPSVRARLLGEASLILTEESTAFADAGRRLWKTAAAEVAFLQLITGRVSYLWVWDQWNQWKGLRYGIGIGYKDYVRLDVAKEPTFRQVSNRSQWVYGLAANNIVGLIDELRQGARFDWSD